jgi:hypothetical protein
MPSFLKDAKRWLPGAIISIVLIGAILYFVDHPGGGSRAVVLLDVGARPCVAYPVARSSALP